jgi:hypothetical protein
MDALQPATVVLLPCSTLVAKKVQRFSTANVEETHCPSDSSGAHCLNLTVSFLNICWCNQRLAVDIPCGTYENPIGFANSL